MSFSGKNSSLKRHHKRLNSNPKLSLVSLMDIFTILVFFLMVNASDVQVLNNDKSLELPVSTSEESAREALLLTINQKDVILQGRAIVSVDEMMAAEEVVIASLTKELEYQAANAPELTEEQLAEGRAINIMADKEVPYALLKKILQTSASAGYTNISLAVDQVAAATDAEVMAAAEEGSVL